MTDHERINELEARVVALERIIKDFQSGIVDWAAHAITQAQQARNETP